MAGFMDDAQSNIADMRERYEELRRREESGELDDTGRQELQQLRDKFDTTEEM